MFFTYRWNLINKQMSTIEPEAWKKIKTDNAQRGRGKKEKGQAEEHK